MSENFYTILTDIGKAKIANAHALGNTVKFLELALGDSNGSYYSPTESQSSLRNEVWRGTINNISIDASNPNWIVLETIIMAEDGGFTIREAGIYDDQGDLLAVGKYPETYKPVMSEGSSKDLYVRMILEVTNSATVELKVDPSVILATKKDLSELRREVTEPKYSEPLTVLESIHRLENTVKGQVSVGLKGQTDINLVKSSNMDKDTNTDGVVDDFTRLVQGGVELTSSFDTIGKAQKLDINYNTATGNGQVYQDIPAKSGEIISVSTEAKAESVVGNFKGQLTLACYDSSNVWLGSIGNITFTNTSFTTLKIENKIALASTAKVRIILQGICYNPGDSGTVKFRKAKLRKESTIGDYISSGVKSTISKRIKSIGKNLFDKSKATPNTYPSETTGDILLSPLYYSSDYIKVKANTHYIASGNNIARRHAIYDINKNFISGEISNSIFVPANGAYVVVSIDKDVGEDKLDVYQLEEGTVATAYELYQESTQYFILPQGVLHSLPNGVTDEIRDKKLYKRTVKYVLQSGDIDSLDTSNVNLDRVVIGLDAFSSLADQTNEVDNSFYVEGFGSEVRLGDADLLTSEYKYSTGTVALLLLVPKGTYVDLAAAQADLAGTALIYQLAQVDVIENGERGFSITGSLETFNGETTIITEPYLRKPYTTHSTSITLDYTIEAIDKLLVFQNGSFIETSGALSLDGKTITVSESGIYQVEGKIKSEEHAGHELVVTHPINTSGSLESIGDLANTNASLIGDYGRKLWCIGNAYMALQLGLNQQGTTAERPKNPMAGDMYFDTTLSRPIWYNGSGWIDAVGTAV